MARKNLRFSQKATDYIELKMKEYNLNATKTIERILAEHEQFNLVEEIYQRFKKDLDVIRVRTGYADKNTRIGLELWNSFLLQNKVGECVTTDIVLTTPVRQATEKIEQDISVYRQKKIEKENKNKGD